MKTSTAPRRTRCRSRRPSAVRLSTALEGSEPSRVSVVDMGTDSDTLCRCLGDSGRGSEPMTASVRKLRLGLVCAAPGVGSVLGGV
jgi:hypothetical protein